MPGFAAESDWRKAGQGMKAGTERSQAFVASIEADVGDAVIPREQHSLCVIDPQPGYKLVRRLVEGGREEAMEIERGQPGVRSGVSQ